MRRSIKRDNYDIYIMLRATFYILLVALSHVGVLKIS